MGKEKCVSEVSDVQPRGSPINEVKFGSKTLWTTIFPPSFDRWQGFRSRSEPLMHKKPSSNCEATPKKKAFEVGSQLEWGFSASPLNFCRSLGYRKRCSGERASSLREVEVLRKPSNNEDKKRFLGHVGFDHRGSSNTVFPSNIIIRGKRLNFMGTCGMVVMKNMEVSSLPSQSPLSSFPSSCGLILPIPSPSVPVLPSSVIQS